ncbi:hypothetical protein EYF80_030133 [Liparis tanakae]|uniref:Uncharacterized protein n=1 Tax=Liparis tanakae TaxID=230148 RepID=A0A4Z2H191_9TELE|nr:hypothetical protein EYF80_030133 [Liparis tanakae]
MVSVSSSESMSGDSLGTVSQLQSQGTLRLANTNEVKLRSIQELQNGLKAEEACFFNAIRAAVFHQSGGLFKRRALERRIGRIPV